MVIVMYQRRLLIAAFLATTAAPFHCSSASAFSHQPDAPSSGGIRLNKVFKKTHSRRQADALIDAGRVAVNGQPVVERGGFLVVPFVDEVTLDGRLVKGWEEMNGIMPAKDETRQDYAQRGRPSQINHVGQQIATKQFQYIKYWKPRGVTCTTDRNDRDNIIDAIIDDGHHPEHRIYPVGRLDKDTSGLILLTSDGRLPNSALRMKNKQPKVYEAVVDRRLRDADLSRLRDGVVITTDVARNGQHRALTQKTLPCEVEKVDNYCLRMTLVEGRNRQIRKMTAALDYHTVELTRIEFMGIQMDSLQGPGDWALLNEQEMNIVRTVLANALDERKLQ